MAQTNVIPAQKIQDAAAGNEQLREILLALSATTNLQQQVTSTTGKNVPPQVKANVSFLKGNYIVEIQNPGAIPPTSSLQSAQVAANKTTATNNAQITPLYHQIRYATSPQFNISSAVTTLGGTTGSTQTYWTLANIPAGRFFFQVRSSYDGINFNLWRNANGGQTITQQADGVTVETTNNAVFGLFELPGKQLVSFGAGLVSDGGTFGVPSELFTSAMQAIAGPNGFPTSDGNLAHGIIADSVSIVTATGQATSGPPDFPTAVSMRYKDGEGHEWAGSANIFAFCYDPLGTNVTEERTADGLWVDFVLPGGAHLSIGSGVTADGANLALPSTMPWVDGTNMNSIVSPAFGFDSGRQARGIGSATITGTTMHCTFVDTTTGVWSSTGNWFAVAWSAGLPVATVTGGQWLVLTTPTGTKFAIGAGAGANFSSFDLPTGFTTENMLSIATPASVDVTEHPMAGVVRCGILGTTLELTYADISGNSWAGDVNWFAFAWQ